VGTVRPRNRALTVWLAERSAFDVAEQLSAIGVPACVVRDAAELLADPQAAARSMLIDAPSYAGVTARLVASPISLGASGPSIAPAAAAGEHAAEVLSERLGYSPEQIDQLAAAGLITRWPATPVQEAL
jgi:crotonobetainyl-CoA:carnitine CoA-transferase CaiB-like acyl-CoA transferase